MIRRTRTAPRIGAIALFASFLLGVAGCAAPVQAPIATGAANVVTAPVAVQDLRAAQWKRTAVVQLTTGVVQRVGDDLFPGKSLPDYLVSQLSPTLIASGAKAVSIKTADIRLSIPGAKVDETLLATQVAMSGWIAAPIVGLLAQTSKDKTAAAVLCASVDGRDYLGNDARLFRFGGEGELKQSIQAAIAALAKNISTGATTTSVACQPGWEGGQPQ
jgi:hypothetical protein